MLEIALYLLMSQTTPAPAQQLQPPPPAETPAAPTAPAPAPQPSSPPPPPLATPVQVPVAPQIPGTGLTPFQPPEGTKIFPSLRTGPSETSLEVRKVLETDKITFLRTMGEWYEVDVVTLDGLTFHGWAKGSLALERKAPEVSAITAAKTATTDPLKVSGITWFWSADAKERGSLRFHLGFQNLLFQLRGTTSAGGNQPVPPGYNFNGLALTFSGEIIPLTTKIFEKKLFPVLRMDYLFGFHRVSFANPFPQIPEVAGNGYEVQTQCFRIEGLTRYRAKEFSNGYLQFGLGLGFYYHTISPDLSPVQGGTYAGQLVFFDNAVSSISIPIEVKWQFLDNFYVMPKYYFLANPKVSESASQTAGLTVNGMPLAFSLTGGWNFSEKFALEAELDWLDVGTKGGSGTRFGVTYTDGKTDIESRRFMAGINYSF